MTGSAMGVPSASVAISVSSTPRRMRGCRASCCQASAAHWVEMPSSVPASRYCQVAASRSEEHTSELQSLMRISYAVFCLKKKTKDYIDPSYNLHQSTHYTQ